MADETSTGPLTCEFCDCQLSRVTGEMTKRSKKATAMMALDDENAKLRDAITSKDATIAQLREDLEKAKAAPQPSPSPEPVGAGRDWL